MAAKIRLEIQARVANFSQAAIVSVSVAVCTLIRIFIHDHITRGHGELS